jgi:hypothetical protein
MIVSEQSINLMTCGKNPDNEISNHVWFNTTGRILIQMVATPKQSRGKLRTSRKKPFAKRDI